MSDYLAIAQPVLDGLPTLFGAVTGVFTAVLVPKFALRIGRFAVRSLSGVAGGESGLQSDGRRAQEHGAATMKGRYY